MHSFESLEPIGPERTLSFSKFSLRKAKLIWRLKWFIFFYCDDFHILWSSSLNNWLILNSTVNIFSNIFIITRFEVVSQFTFTHVASSPVAVHLKKIFSLMPIDLFWFYAPIAQCNDIIWMCAEWRTYHDLQKVSLSKYHSWNISRKQSQYLKITRQNDGSCE